MHKKQIVFGGQSLSIAYPLQASEVIDFLFSNFLLSPSSDAAETDTGIAVRYNQDNLFSSSIVLRSGAVQRNGKGILLPDSEKNDPIPWLLERGYGYLTDRFVHFKNNSRQFSAFPCPPLINQFNLSAAAD
ncbi:MAG: hypothetical protein D3909_14815, partial [Candidatus Electrothrix sp. ATG1]|nr:hypothetical protein [Candidatus Electrothrix sp. ATG1]